MKKIFSIRASDSAFSIAALVLRVGAGSLMLVNHGLDKLINFSDKASRFSDPFGIGSTTSLALVVFAEFFCAAFIILGLFTRFAAIPLIIGMGVALFYSHKGAFFGKGESAGLYMACFIAIMLLGAGKISLDRYIK
jgi:putative oxidoreductase